MSDAVRVTRLLDARREEVFRAWTDPDELKRWWGPGRFRTTHAEVDLRPGGRYVLVLEPPGGGAPMRLEGVFREVSPPERLVYTWQWQTGVPDRRVSVVTVEFRELGERTELVLVQDAFSGPGPVAMYQTGWESGVGKLAAHLGEEE